MNFPICIYKSLYSRTKINGSYRLVARYRTPSRKSYIVLWPIIMHYLPLSKQIGHLSKQFWSRECNVSANLDTFLKEKKTGITSDIKVKLMYTLKRIGYNWMNEKTGAKYPKLSVIIEPILLAFSCLYMVEFWLRHAHYLLIKQRSNFNIERFDLQLKCTNL